MNVPEVSVSEYIRDVHRGGEDADGPGRTLNGVNTHLYGCRKAQDSGPLGGPAWSQAARRAQAGSQGRAEARNQGRAEARNQGRA